MNEFSASLHTSDFPLPYKYLCVCVSYDLCTQHTFVLIEICVFTSIYVHIYMCVCGTLIVPLSKLLPLSPIYKSSFLWQTFGRRSKFHFIAITIDAASSDFHSSFYCFTLAWQINFQSINWMIATFGIVVITRYLFIDSYVTPHTCMRLCMFKYPVLKKSLKLVVMPVA